MVVELTLDDLESVCPRYSWTMTCYMERKTLFLDPRPVYWQSLKPKSDHPLRRSNVGLTDESETGAFPVWMFLVGAWDELIYTRHRCFPSVVDRNMMSIQPCDASGRQGLGQVLSPQWCSTRWMVLRRTSIFAEFFCSFICGIPTFAITTVNMTTMWQRAKH